MLMLETVLPTYGKLNYDKGDIKQYWGNNLFIKCLCVNYTSMFVKLNLIISHIIDMNRFLVKVALSMKSKSQD